MTREDLISRGIFVLGMASLGVAGAFVVLNRPQPSASTPPAPPRHHVLDSPYGAANGAQSFVIGQPQGQTLTALGRAYPSSLAHSYRTAGYDWLAVTDAGSLTPPQTFRANGLLSVQGADLPYGFGHFMAINITTIEQAVTPQVAVDWVHNQGGVAFVARPLQTPAMSYETIAALQGLDGIQVFNARLAREDPPRADATALWDRLLTDHHVVWGIVGDDSIDDKGADSVVGQTSVGVQVNNLTPASIVDALRRGAFVNGNGVKIDSVSVTADTISVVTADADTIQFIGSGGRVRRTVSGKAGDYKVDWSEGYIRVLASGRGGRAWTQPIVVNP